MFKKVSRKTLEDDINLVEQYNLSEEHSTPFVIQTNHSDIFLEIWAKKNLEMLNSKLLECGALLFRGFNIDTTEKLQKASLAFVPELLPYIEKRSPRTTLDNKVYSSTIHPSDQYIHFHNTTSFSHQWPMKIWFCCFQPAEEWGYTPIADCRTVLNTMDKELRDKFMTLGIQYVRNFQKEVGLSWQHTFNTENKSEVEAYCKQHGIMFEWLDEDKLRTKQIRHAVAQHPITKEAVWFNQSHHFHVLSLEKEVSGTLLNTYAKEDLPRNSYFGNGEEITQDIIDEITRCYKTAEVAFPWEKGDVLMLDNMLTAHSRTPYKGNRLIALTLGEMYQPLYNGGGFLPATQNQAALETLSV